MSRTLLNRLYFIVAVFFSVVFAIVGFYIGLAYEKRVTDVLASFLIDCDATSNAGNVLDKAVLLRQLKSEDVTEVILSIEEDLEQKVGLLHVDERYPDGTNKFICRSVFYTYRILDQMERMDRDLYGFCLSEGYSGE